MDNVFIQGLHKEEGEGVRVRFVKSTTPTTPSECEFLIKIVDNSYDEYPRMYISAKNAKLLVAEITQMLDYHKELLREDLK